MKHFRRWLFNGLVMLSPTICILWLVLLPFSFIRKTYLIRINQQSNVILAMLNGYVIGSYNNGPGMVAMIGAHPDSWEFGFDPPVKGVPIVWEMSFRPHYFDSTAIPNIRRQFATVPLWVLVFVSGIPWASRSAWKRLHYRPTGSCQACGYDLRATPDRCPECGMVPAKP